MTVFSIVQIETLLNLQTSHSFPKLILKKPCKEYCGTVFTIKIKFYMAHGFQDIFVIHQDSMLVVEYQVWMSWTMQDNAISTEHILLNP